MSGRIPEMLQAKICEEQSLVRRWDLRTAPGGPEHLTPPPRPAALGTCAVLRLLVWHVFFAMWESKASNMYTHQLPWQGALSCRCRVHSPKPLPQVRG